MTVAQAQNPWRGAVTSNRTAFLRHRTTKPHRSVSEAEASDEALYIAKKGHHCIQRHAIPHVLFGEMLLQEGIFSAVRRWRRGLLEDWDHASRPRMSVQRSLAAQSRGAGTKAGGSGRKCLLHDGLAVPLPLLPLKCCCRGRRRRVGQDPPGLRKLRLLRRVPTLRYRPLVKWPSRWCRSALAGFSEEFRPVFAVCAAPAAVNQLRPGSVQDRAGGKPV